MTSNQPPTSGGITAVDVNGTAKFQFIQKHFGARMLLRAEALINGTLRNMCEDYRGDDWRFVELSNGGFYMAPTMAPRERKNPRAAPPGTMRLSIPGTFVDIDVSAHAAGIIVTLYVLGHLAGPDDEHFAENYYRLLDYAHGHPEYALIAEAID